MGLLLFVVVLCCAGPFLLIGGLLKTRRGGRDENRADIPRAEIADGRGSRRRAQVGDGILQSVIGAVLSAGLGFIVYVVVSILNYHPAAKGRLLRIRDRAELPPAQRGATWTDGVLPALAGLGVWERTVVGQAWLLSARMEHASVAAFSQLSLHLAALGAPASLVERTHAAALDEIRHAQRCFALASAYSARSWTAGPIATLAERSVADARPVTFERLACGSLIDGCVAEGLAADVARVASSHAQDPLVAATLAAIAVDEARHAELAWDVLAWCLAEGGVSTRRAVRTRAEHLAEELAPRLPDVPGVSAHRLREHGFLQQQDLATLAEHRLTEATRRVLTMV